MTPEQLQTCLDAAITAVRQERPSLALARVHERSTAHRLAVQMEAHFPGWNIDCDYDRDGEDTKRLLNLSPCGGRTTDRILPDIIVHHRGESGREHNLLVIELKKDAGEDPCDAEKLRRFTDHAGGYQYQFGLYLNINDGAFDATWYVDGASCGNTATGRPVVDSNYGTNDLSPQHQA